MSLFDGGKKEKTHSEIFLNGFVVEVVGVEPIYLHISKSVCTINTNRYVNTLTSQKRPKQMQ